MTFHTGPGAAVEADASGEQTGDWISDVPSTSVEHSREGCWRRCANRLESSASRLTTIAVALKDPSRRVE